MKKKILVRAYTQVNLGDDLFLKILVDRYPDVSFTLLSELPMKKFGVYNKFQNLYYMTFCVRVCRKICSLICTDWADKVQMMAFKRKIKSSIRNYDAFLSIGGSIFMQQGKTDNLLVKMNCYIYKNFKHCFIIGANFGPFEDQKFLNIYTDAFRECESIIFRDNYSRLLFPELSNISTEPDIVFQYQKHVDKIIDSVGFSVIDLSNRKGLKYKQNDYEDFLVEAVKELLCKGKQVFLFSFCKAEGDENSIQRIASKLKNSNLQVVLYDGNIDDFLDKYAAIESMLCTRFHAMILSLIFNQKLVPLIYSKKMQQVLDDIGFCDYSINIKDIDKELAHESIEKLDKCDYHLPETIRNQSKQMFKNFDYFVNKTNSLITD
jgi:colanic acid/amylovoran biosynthesis protein